MVMKKSIFGSYVCMIFLFFFSLPPSLAFRRLFSQIYQRMGTVLHLVSVMAEGKSIKTVRMKNAKYWMFSGFSLKAQQLWKAVKWDFQPYSEVSDQNKDKEKLWNRQKWCTNLGKLYAYSHVCSMSFTLCVNTGVEVYIWWCRLVFHKCSHGNAISFA